MEPARLRPVKQSVYSHQAISGSENIHDGGNLATMTRNNLLAIGPNAILRRVLTKAITTSIQRTFKLGLCCDKNSTALTTSLRISVQSRKQQRRGFQQHGRKLDASKPWYESRLRNHQRTALRRRAAHFCAKLSSKERTDLGADGQTAGSSFSFGQCASALR